MKISFRNISKCYGKKEVISNLNLDIPLKRGAVGLIGPNGAGKTTIFKMISGIYIGTEGEISVKDDDSKIIVAGNEYNNWSHMNIAFIPSNDRDLSYKHTVYDNVLYYGLLKGSKKREIENDILRYSEELQLNHILYERVEKLSTGQKKIAQLLCAFCSNLSHIVLDEPTSGLDIGSKIECLGTLTKITGSKTVIISSHDVDFLSNFCETFYFIFHGKLVDIVDEKMTLEEIYLKYENLKNGGISYE